MPKLQFTCKQCDQPFEVWPAFVRHAEKRGSAVQFCSKACLGKARSAGKVPAKRRTGQSFVCEICSTPFYRSASYIAERAPRFCSEPCRVEGLKSGLVDKTLPRPGALRGETITCQICGTARYRKKSMIERNIDKTGGKPACVSAYSRSLWGLEPRPAEVVALPRPKRKVRRTNFSAAQRMAWLDTKCARCGVTSNLSLDHIVPVCAGGESVRENAQTLCQPCNNWKATNLDRPLTRKRRSSGG